MATTNDITGDKIQSKFSDKYAAGWDLIFGKKNKSEVDLNVKTEYNILSESENEPLASNQKSAEVR